MSRVQILPTLRRAIRYALMLAVLALLGIVIYLSFRPDLMLGSALRHAFQAAPQPVKDNPPILEYPAARVSWVADLADWSLDESSGLTASPRHADTLWSINDSGGGPYLFALGLDGGTRAVFKVDTDDNYDWESLDAFELDGFSYLVIGDIGDNFRWRKSVSILVVPEPATLTERAVVDTPLEVAWRIRFTYPEAPRDSEAMAVDLVRQRILLLTKREHPPQLFSVPLLPDNVAELTTPAAAEPKQGAAQILKAQPVALLRELPLPTVTELEREPQATYRHMPSGMDVSGNLLFVTTYKHAYLYQLGDRPSRPQRVSLPSLGQREALTFAHGSSDTAYVSRERLARKGVADLFKIELFDGYAQTPAEAVADEP